MFENFTWQQFEGAVGNLVEGLAPYRNRIVNVFGIPRGGLVLAVVLSHRLGLPLTERAESDTLVVDDISDSGKTLLPYRHKGCIIATLHVVRGTRVYPDVWVHVRELEWVNYPWETFAVQEVRNG